MEASAVSFVLTSMMMTIAVSLIDLAPHQAPLPAPRAQPGLKTSRQVRSHLEDWVGAAMTDERELHLSHAHQH